jgi:hypothetical protein
MYRVSVALRKYGDHPDGSAEPGETYTRGTFRPRGRRNLDLAGPPLRDLPASHGARERALAAAKDLPQLDLLDALELTVLVARKDPRRHPRVASRWLLRYLEEDPHATIDEAALAASSLIALTGVTHQEAAQTLRAMAERATSRRRSRGVA